MTYISPELSKRMINTQRLINIGRPDLIPPLSPDFIDVNTYNKILQLKPWIETAKIPIQRFRPYTGVPNNDRILVLCVDFSDEPAKASIDSIRDRYFSPTALSGKTFRNFYIENSNGLFTPEGDVHGWYRAPQPKTFYTDNKTGLGTYPNNNQKLFEDVMNLVVQDPNVNLNNIDANNDNRIDHVIIVVSGTNASYTGDLNDFWPIASPLSPTSQIYAGKTFSYFALVTEFIKIIDRIFGTQKIGVDVHEFGHELGLIDLYDNSLTSFGAGIWSLMSQGNLADDSATPTHLDAWSKFLLGWSNPIIDPTGITNLQNAETSKDQIHFTTYDPGTLIIIENRQKISFDSFLPGDGLLIWRITTNVPNNDNPACYRIGIIQADGSKHLETRSNSGDENDPFPGALNIRSIGPDTSPSSLKLCDGTPIDIDISSISNSGPIMNFNSSIPISPVCTVPPNQPVVSAGRIITIRADIINNSPSNRKMQAIFRDESSVIGIREIQSLGPFPTGGYWRPTILYKMPNRNVQLTIDTFGWDGRAWNKADVKIYTISTTTAPEAAGEGGLALISLLGLGLLGVVLLSKPNPVPPITSMQPIEEEIEEDISYI